MDRSCRRGSQSTIGLASIDFFPQFCDPRLQPRRHHNRLPPNSTNHPGTSRRSFPRRTNATTRSVAYLIHISYITLIILLIFQHGWHTTSTTPWPGHLHRPTTGLATTFAGNSTQHGVTTATSSQPIYDATPADHTIIATGPASNDHQRRTVGHRTSLTQHIGTITNHELSSFFPHTAVPQATSSSPALSPASNPTATVQQAIGSVGTQLLQDASMERNRSFPQQSTAGASISPRIGKEARTAILEGKFLPAQYYYGRPPHQATDYQPEHRTKIGSTTDGVELALVTSSPSTTISNKPVPIDSEWGFILAVTNWFGAVASIRPDLTKDALELMHTVMQFVDKYRCWRSALTYFDAIRRDRAIDGNEASIPLGQKDGAFLTECALISIRQKQGFQPYGASTSSATSNTGSKKDTCFQWNKGKCRRPASECKYSHRCSSCAGAHPRTECPTAPADTSNNNTTANTTSTNSTNSANKKTNTPKPDNGGSASTGN